VKNVPFDPINGPKLMFLLGYQVEHHEAHWEEVGSPESGPKLDGHHAYDLWTKGDHYMVVSCGVIAEVGTNPPEPDIDPNAWEQTLPTEPGGMT
jgi:hypothetical protein